MKFKCNNMTYEIIEKNQKELQEEFLKDFPDEKGTMNYGYTSYLNHTIAINKELHTEEKRNTLIHELTHCWLHNYAHAYSNYEQEDVCEVVANIHDFINDILRQYEEFKIEVN